MNITLNNLLVLGKVRITAFVSISAALGYLLANGTADWSMLLPVLGVFILSGGSSALNQYQEHIYDGMMHRTMFRPIPTGSITPAAGLLISIILILCGEFMLLAFGSMEAFMLGWFAVLWYNGLYTPLKRFTALAVVPGALIGAIPPAIGWVSGGGSLLNPQIWVLGLFFFIWQIPHFWLLVLIYDKDYERAGYPTLTQIFTHKQLTRVTFVWIVALAVSCMLIPLFGLSNSLITDVLLVVAGFWLIIRTSSLLNQYQNKNQIRFAFMNINFYVLAVALLLSADKLFKL